MFSVLVVVFFTYLCQTKSEHHFHNVHRSLTTLSNWNWTEVSSAADWTARGYHTSVVYDNKIYILGGYDGGPYLNDVWYSADGGYTWVEVAGSAEWSARRGHTSVVFDNKIFVMGGLATPGNDVWYSSDGGVSWIEATGSAEWIKRRYFCSVVYNNKIIVLGGLYNHVDGVLNALDDVWSSSDGGFTWMEVTPSAEWSARYQHSSVVFDNKIFVMGGYAASNLNDVWSSSDGGLNWVQVNVYNNKIYVMGGSASGVSLNDVWYTSDGGLTWMEAGGFSGWQIRNLFTSVVYDKKLYVLGGLALYDDSTKLNDIWYLGDNTRSPSATAETTKAIVKGGWIGLNVGLVVWVVANLR